MATTLGLLLALTGLAQAQNWEASTQLTLHRLPITGTLTPGHKLVLRGKLKSPRPACVNHQVVRLYVNGTFRKKVTTDAGGHYRFVRHPQRAAKFSTRYAGRISGRHPNRHVCDASTSKSLTVQIA